MKYDVIIIGAGPGGIVCNDNNDTGRTDSDIKNRFVKGFSRCL